MRDVYRVADLLLRVGGALRRDEPIAVDDAPVFAAALKVLNLSGEPGHHLPCTAAAFEERNRWLQSAARFFPGPDRAQRLHQAWNDYAGRIWKRASRHDTCPHPPGTIEEIFWKMLKARNRVLGPRAIRHVLAKSSQ